MSTRDQGPSGFSQFLAEMKRRHVVRFSIGYAAAAFVILQLAEIVFPAFEIGETGLRILVVAIALLFPPAVVLAWVFDITVEGIKRTEDLPGATDRRLGRLTPRLALLVFTLVVVGGLAAWMAREGMLEVPQRQRRGGGPSNATPQLVAYDPSAPIRSLAVLPLENFTEGGGQDYFSAGMHEELIAQLSQIAGLRVVSRTSVLRYAGTTEPIPRIGRDLQVDAVIEGSVRRGADTVRITVQLIHAASDTHIWTKQYDRSLKDDVLALQSEVALDIARQVQAELSPEETNILERTASRDVDPAAQDEYLRGKYEYEKGTQESYQAALEHFQQAVERDSAFAPALAGLAGTRFLLGMAGSEPTDTAIELARREAEQAVDMDSTSVEAREVLTIIRQAMPALRTEVRPTAAAPPTPPGASVTAVPDVPTLDTAFVAAMTQMGRRIEEQVRQRTYDSQRAGRIQQFLAARQLVAGGLFTEATRVLSDLVDTAPEMDAAWELMARAEISAGDPQGAVGAIEGWSARGGSDAPDQESVRALQSAVTADGARGYWSWMRARLDERRAAGQPVSLTEYAAAQAGSGDSEGALATLERALERHDRGWISLPSDPVWDALRSDPRFTEIARKSRAMHYEPGARGRPPGGR